MSTVAYVGIGSNLGDRRVAMRAAVRALEEHPDVVVLAESRLVRSAPAPPADAGAPWFLNGVVRVDTRLTARDLLGLLHTIEADLGRPPRGDGAAEERGAPRIIDLDLLVFGDERHARPDLTVPHPRIAERPFVLEPLAELDPALAARLAQGLPPTAAP